MSLNLTVPLGTHETPASFTSRLAAVHRLSAREFCLDFEIAFQSVVDGDAGAIATIARMGGVDPTVLASHAFVRGEIRNCEYRGERLIRSILRRAHVRVCPRCLQEDIGARPDLAAHHAVYNRGLWLIEAIRTCPEHNLALVEISNDQAPNSLHDFVHHVSPVLPNLDRLAERTPQRPPSGLESYILARLDGARRTPFLDSLELHAAIKTCEMIGAVAVFGRTANLKRLTDNGWWRAGAAGFAIAASGPSAIGEFLKDLQHTYPYGRGGKEGPQALYGRFYQWLEFGAEHAAYDPVRAMVGRHIRDNLPVGPGDVVFGIPVAERALHSIRTLSTETGLHFKRLRKLLLGAGLIGGRQTALTDNIVVFDARLADALVAKIKGALSLIAAGKYLNAPRVHIRLLAKNRFIVPFVAASAFSANDQYAPADLDEFLRRLLAGAHAVGKATPGQMSIPAAAKRACCSAADIIRLILDHRLNWIGRATSERGYLSARVDVDEVRAKVRGTNHGGLTLREVANRLGTADRVIGPLIAGGHLTTRTALNPINRCPQIVIMPNEVARFSRKYVSLFTLAKARRKHFKRVLKELDAKGVEPAFKPAKIGARFYNRVEIASLTLSGRPDSMA